MPEAAYCTPHPQGCALRLLVKPNARQSAFTGAQGGQLGVRLAARPVEGGANAELLHFLSKALGVPPSRLSLSKGTTSKFKQVVVAGLTVAEVEKRLAAHP